MTTLEPRRYDFSKIPFGEIERVGQISLLNRDLFCVSWLLGRYCNYSCSYCWPYASSKQKDHRPLSLVLKTMDEIKRQAREKGFNSFHFSFSGGEPTMHPGYLEILSHYAADTDNCNVQTVHMTSNCSPGLKWFEKYVKATEPLHWVTVTASYHKEFTTREKLAKKLVFLQENDVQVTINMVMVPDRFEELWEDALFFQEQMINVTLKPQSDPSASHVVSGYTGEQLDRLQTGLPQTDFTREHLQRLQKASRRTKYPSRSSNPASLSGEQRELRKVMQVELTDSQGKAWFMDQAERFNAFNFNKFQGWECSSGYRSIIIREPDGAIKRSYSCHDEPLGNIETGFQLFDRPMPCKTPSCVSSADSKLPKRKAGSRLPLWPGDLTFQEPAPKKDLQKTFCPLPWVSQSVRNNGDVRLCCHANTGHDRGLVRKRDGSIYNAGRDQLSEARNSNLLKQVRLDMLNGVWNPACARCQRENQAGVRSRQQFEGDIWKGRFEWADAQRVTQADGAINTEEVSAKYYDVRFGNLCNLKCRSCGPTDSSSWYTDHVKVWGTNKYNESFGRVQLLEDKNGRFQPEHDIYNWFESETFWEQMEKNIPHIEHFHCVGGEPLLIHRQWDFLNKCIERGQAAKMIVDLNSNITKIPDKAWKIWSHFKEVRLGASIDSYGKMNEYIRHPSRWKDIEANLNLFEDAPGNFNVWVATTVMVYNIYYLADILRFWLKKKYFRVGASLASPITTPHPLHNPSFLNVQMLPAALKEKITQHLREQKPELMDLIAEVREPQEIPAYQKAVDKIIDKYVNFMNQRDQSDSFEKFWVYTKRLDKVRGESFEQTFPEFYQWLEPYVRHIDVAKARVD